MAAVVVVSVCLVDLLMGWLLSPSRGNRSDEPEMMLAMRGASDGLWVWDIDKDEVTITPRINEVLGTNLPLRGITSEQLFSNFHPEDREELTNQIVRHMRGETDFFICDYRVVQADGSVRWVEDRGIAEHDQNGKVVRMGGSVTSIARRKMAEEKLARSEALLKGVTNNTPAVIYIKDREGRYILVNRQFESLFHSSNEQTRGRTDADIFPEEIARAFRKNDQEVLRTLKPLEVEEVVPQDGENHTYLSIKFPLLGKQGEVSGVCGISTDITARKRMEEDLALSRATLETKVRERTRELETSEKRFKDFAEIGSDWFWETGPDHCFKKVSKTVVALTNADLDKLYTSGRRELAHPEDIKENPEKWAAHYEDLDAHREFKDFEYRHIAPNGRLMHIRVSGRPFFAEDGDFLGYRGVGADVTIEKQSEAALREAKRQADEANLAKSEFLSRMSHELRTPLNGILGFAQLLELDKDENLTEEQVRFINDIRKSGDHLLELINEVLDLARIESGGLEIKLEPLDPAEVMNECLDMIRPLAEKTGIHIGNALPMVQEAGSQGSNPHDGGGVISDRVRLKQIFVNLVSNAIKYNRVNGTVTLRYEEAPSGFMRISVADTGAGIANEDLNEIFQPFTRLKGNGSVEGTGVGLSVTQKLVELLGGDVGVKSTVGEGSVFWVDIPSNDGRLPRTEKTKAREKAENTAFSTEPGREICVLYIEDNRANIRFMRELLKKIPSVKIVVAETGEDGIRLAREQKPDLILMDINLPGMNGYEALKEIRRTERGEKKVPILALSALAMPDDVNKGLDAGFDGYLTKPLNVGKTLTAIFDALG